MPSAAASSSALRTASADSTASAPYGFQKRASRPPRGALFLSGILPSARCACRLCKASGWPGSAAVLPQRPASPRFFAADRAVQSGGSPSVLTNFFPARLRQRPIFARFARRCRPAAVQIAARRAVRCKNAGGRSRRFASLRLAVLQFSRQIDRPSPVFSAILQDVLLHLAGAILQNAVQDCRPALHFCRGHLLNLPHPCTMCTKSRLHFWRSAVYFGL